MDRSLLTLSTIGILLIFLLSSCGVNERTDFPEDELRQLVENFRGDVGVYILDLESGADFSLNGDTLFPTASTIKIPIMIGLFDKMDQGEIGYGDTVLYDGEHDDTWGNDIINQLQPGAEVEVKRLIHLMMSTSNNTASLWNQHLAGTGTRINELMDELGFTDTKVNSRTDGRHSNWERYGWGQSTPKNLAEMLLQMHRGELISRHASEKMYRIMTRNFWDGESLSQIPPYVNVASKNGSVSRSKAEVLFVNGPSGDYLFSVMTKNQEDDRREDDNEGFVLLREISALLYSHFEPGDSWSPNPEMAEF